MAAKLPGNLLPKMKFKGMDNVGAGGGDGVFKKQNPDACRAVANREYGVKVRRKKLMNGGMRSMLQILHISLTINFK